jgi:hypothetical protein
LACHRASESRLLAKRFGEAKTFWLALSMSAAVMTRTLAQFAVLCGAAVVLVRLTKAGSIERTVEIPRFPIEVSRPRAEDAQTLLGP